MAYTDRHIDIETYLHSVGVVGHHLRLHVRLSRRPSPGTWHTHRPSSALHGGPMAPATVVMFESLLMTFYNYNTIYRALLLAFYTRAACDHALRCNLVWHFEQVSQKTDFKRTQWHLIRDDIHLFRDVILEQPSLRNIDICIFILQYSSLLHSSTHLTIWIFFITNYN